MIDKSISPQELFSQLFDNASTRKKRSLEIINQVCMEQQERGSVDFSIATIGRLSEAAGGPTERTIRNKDGAEYQALMHTWASQANGVTRKPPSKKEPSAMEDILNMIDNPSARALVGVMIAENRKLKGENTLLKTQMQVSIDMRPNTQLTGANGKGIVQVLPAFNDLSPIEIGALEHAISDTLMEEQGWTQDEHGRIKKGEHTIFKIGFVNAIRKILDNVNKKTD
jgi:hypothetical protein